MADISKFKPRSGNVFENLGALREQLRNEELERVGRRRYERGPGADSKEASSTFNDKYGEDDSGALRDITLDEYLSGFTKDEVHAATKKYAKKVGIREAASGMYGPEGKTTMEDVGLTFPKDHTFKTKAAAQKYAREQVAMQIIRDNADAAGIVITPLEGGGRRSYAELQDYVNKAGVTQAQDKKDVEEARRIQREWGLKDTPKPASAGDSLESVSRRVGDVPVNVDVPTKPINYTMENGPYKNPDKNIEWAQQGRAGELHNSNLAEATSRINVARRGADLAENEFEYQKYSDDRQWNNDITIEEMKQAAAKATVDAKNAHAIILHDKQFEADMKFFDKKKEAYEQERLMDYIQGGVNGLGSLFQLFML